MTASKYCSKVGLKKNHIEGPKEAKQLNLGYSALTGTLHFHFFASFKTLSV